jgi:hypothetical protein
LSEPLLLYSTVTSLAYHLGQRYYGEMHYVWCAPARRADQYVSNNPPSSDPLAIYWSLLREIKGNDGHSSKINDNRHGLILGANGKEKQGVIDSRTRELIEAVIGRATINDFRPLFLAMPYAMVKPLICAPGVGNIASATSQEYIIESLPRECFDILELDS